jgi:hypothetical protein
MGVSKQYLFTDSRESSVEVEYGAGSQCGRDENLS